MLGAIIGDIAGSRFEFNNYRDTDFELFHKDCCYTDDTIMTVATADALLHGKDFAKCYQEWGRKYPNPMGHYGTSFLKWLYSSDPQPYNSWGNGAAMRVSPIGWINPDLNKTMTLASESASVSHDHPEGLKGAMVTAGLIFKARFGNSKEELKRLTTTSGYDVYRPVNEIRKTNRFDESCQETIPVAVPCFLESIDFEHAVRLAVSVGGDSDTIAAITGSIAEAYYGIPEDLAQRALAYLPDEMKVIINEFENKYGPERI